MKTVVLRSPVLTQSGYGVHARQIARWLLSKPDIEVRFATLRWGDTPWFLDRKAQDGLIDEIMQRSVKPDTKADVSIQLQLPDEWDPSLAPINIGVTAGVETDKCNPAWPMACNTMTTVVVPSQHSKACLVNSGPLNKPPIVIPEAFSDAVLQDDLVQVCDFDTSFNFLVFGQMTGQNAESDRKNIFYTIKWLTEIFKDDPTVGIVLKTNVGRNSLIDRSMTKNLISAVARDSRRGATGPKIHLLHGDLNDGEIASLYRHPKIKALVTLTRGEGFGLPILEAAASGLPIVATGWSGHLDFLKHGKFISIYYQLNELHPSRIDNKIFMPGSRWANPSEEDFKKRITKFRQSFSTPKQWASDLKPIIQQRYSFAAISKCYDDALGEYI
jgi:glycosyltransferase involved in cell wall biosynthesis